MAFVFVGIALAESGAEGRLLSVAVEMRHVSDPDGPEGCNAGAALFGDDGSD